MSPLGSGSPLVSGGDGGGAVSLGVVELGIAELDAGCLDDTADGVLEVKAEETVLLPELSSLADDGSREDNSPLSINELSAEAIELVSSASAAACMTNGLFAVLCCGCNALSFIVDEDTSYPLPVPISTRLAITAIDVPIFSL